jgi:hypothetical protein
VNTEVQLASEVIVRDADPDVSEEPPSAARPEISILAGMQITKAYETANWMKLMVYGDPGVGKTLLAATAWDVEQMRPILCINIEGGTMTFREKYPEIDVITPRDTLDPGGRVKRTGWRKLQDLYEALRKENPYRTIIIDNLSETQKVSMAHVMHETVLKDAERDPDIPAQRDWGKSGEQLRRFVRAFRDLDCHVIYTAWAAKKQDQTTGQITIEPSLPGKLAAEVPGYLDIVLYMYSREEKTEGGGEVRMIRRVLSQPTGKISIAKDRSDKLPTVMQDPTMAKITDLALD